MFVEEELKKENVTYLQNICKQYNIKPRTKSKKEDIIARILKHSRTMNSDRTELHDLLAALKKPALKNPAPLHTFYHTHFNLDDLTDHK